MTMNMVLVCIIRNLNKVHLNIFFDKILSKILILD